MPKHFFHVTSRISFMQIMYEPLHLRMSDLVIIQFYCYISTLGSVVVWDSHMKDGYVCSKTRTTVEDALGDAPTHVASLAWDGKKTSGVVEELLRNATDKAYGANSEW